MTTSDNESSGNNSKKSGHEDTVILQRCAKHGIPYMPQEGCPECEKEKNSSISEEAG